MEGGQTGLRHRNILWTHEYVFAGLTCASIIVVFGLGCWMKWVSIVAPVSSLSKLIQESGERWHAWNALELGVGISKYYGIRGPR